MATHSSIVAWRIPWTGEPGGLQSIGSQRVGHDWTNLACMHRTQWKHCKQEFWPKKWRFRAPTRKAIQTSGSTGHWWTESRIGSNGEVWWIWAWALGPVAIMWSVVLSRLSILTIIFRLRVWLPHCNFSERVDKRKTWELQESVSDTVDGLPHPLIPPLDLLVSVINDF